MGDKYKRVHNQNPRQKNTFLPMLCSKPTIKDIRLPECDRSRSESFSGDPLSPRIGCMGQVKRNNKVAGLPISHRLILTTKNINNTNVVSYQKLKKFFSSKNLLASSSPSTAAVTTAVAVAHGCGSRRRVRAAKKGSIESENCGASFSVADLDPPLPVIKKVMNKNGGGNEMENLWKRRSVGGGIVLQSLEIQQTQHRLQITTV